MTPSDVASYNHQLTHCSIVVAWWLLAPHCLRRRCLVTAGASFPPSPGDCRRLTVSVRRRRLVTAGASLSPSSSPDDCRRLTVSVVSVVVAWWLPAPHCLRRRRVVTSLSPSSSPGDCRRLTVSVVVAWWPHCLHRPRLVTASASLSPSSSPGDCRRLRCSFNVWHIISILL